MAEPWIEVVARFLMLFKILTLCFKINLLKWNKGVTSMNFSTLRSLFLIIKADNLSTSSLQTSYEGIHYGAIFSTDTTPWSILFIRPDNEEYSVNVLPNFKFPSISDLNAFKRFFNIPPATKFSKEFSPFHVLAALDSNLNFRPTPGFYNRSTECVSRKIPDSERVYYYGTINHDQNNDGENFTPDNRRKVKELLPETYERIKNSKISIRFTDWEHTKYRNPTLESDEINSRLNNFGL